MGDTIGDHSVGRRGGCYIERIVLGSSYVILSRVRLTARRSSAAAAVRTKGRLLWGRERDIVVGLGILC